MKIHGKNLSATLLPGARAVVAVVCLLFCAGLWTPSSAQRGREITGTVVDENNLPMPGVTVMVDGTVNGTMTTEAGAFVLTNVPANATLVISCIGYTTQRIEVGTRNNFSIKLVPDAEMLEETVVVAFGQQKKATVTGAIATVSSTDLRKTNTTRLDNALAGRVTGLTSMQNGGGQPGRDGATMYLRGAATTNGKSPLVIVDGVERSDGIRTLDMNEVESISVLKDASATGLYGVRGANGVIIITTRRGQKGKPNLSISFDQSMSEFTVQPERLHSWEYMELRNEALTNSGSPAAYSDEVIAKFKNPLFGLTGNEPNYAELKKMREYLYCDNDYYRMMLKRFTPQSRFSANLSGGTDKVNYFLNIGYIHQDGNLKTLGFDELGYNPQSYMNRFSLRSNLDFHLTKDLTVSLNLASYTEDINMPLAVGMYGGDENWMMRDLIYQATCITPVSVGPTTISEFGVDDGAVVTHSWMDRTAYECINYRGFQTDTKKNLNSTLSANYDLSSLITKGLSINGSVSYDTYNMGILYGQKSVQMYLPVVDYANDTMTYATHSQNPSPLSLGHSRSSNYVIYGQAAINYARKFADKHDVTAMVTAYRRYWESTGADIPYNLIGSAARVTYGYDDRYLFEANMGYNGSEQFAPANRFGFFPSASIGWIASNEKFLKDNSFLTWLKFRGSYGLVGNDSQGGNRFLYMDHISVGGNQDRGVSGLGGSTISEGLLGNKELQWEVAKKMDLGVEIGIFEDLRINFDYFTEDRDHILISRKTIPSFQGLSLDYIPKVNMGVVENHGFEVELKYSHDFKNGFAFNVGGNMGFNDNKVIEYDEVNRGDAYAYPLRTEGYRLGQSWGYLIDWDSPGHGYFTSQEELDQYLSHTTYGFGVPRVGDFVYKDVTGDGVVDDKDISPIGFSSSIPGINYAFNLGAQLKNFDFNILFTGLGRYNSNNWSTAQNVAEYIYQGTYYDFHKSAWTEERYKNGEKITWPALSTAKTTSHQGNDFFIQSRAFLRLKNVELGYNLPQKSLRKIGVKGLRIYASGQNLHYWTKYNLGKHIDPEHNDHIGYPIPKSYMLGFNINF